MHEKSGLITKRPTQSSNEDLTLAMKDNFQPSGVLVKIDKNKIKPDPNQPRKNIEEEAISELLKSIESQGQVQPICVKPADESGHHLIVFGERRWRAIMASDALQTVDCIIKEYAETETLAVQLIENLQREDVPILENAVAIRDFVKLVGSAKEASQQLGITEANISRYNALLNASDRFFKFVRQHKIRDLNGLTNLARAEKSNPKFVSDEIEKLEISGLDNFREASKKILDAAKKSPSKRKTKPSKKTVKVKSAVLVDRVLTLETASTFFKFLLTEEQLEQLSEKSI